MYQVTGATRPIQSTSLHCPVQLAKPACGLRQKQVKMRPLTFLWEHKKLAVHSAVILTLISVAVWDAQQIIMEYIRDNYFSLVKFNVVGDRFPFLDEDNMQVCLNYYNSEGNHTVFSELWTNETARAESAAFFNLTTAISRFHNQSGDLINITALTLRDRVHIAQVLREIQDMDDHIARCVLEDRRNSCNSVAGYTFLQPILKDRVFLEALEIATWYQLQPYIFRRSSSSPEYTKEMTPVFELEHFNHHNVCVDIPLSILRPGRRDPEQFQLGVISDSNSTLFQEDLPKPMVHVMVPTTVFSAASPSAGSQMNILVKIASIGIYEQSITATECVDESSVRLRTQLTPEESSARYSKTVAKICRCVPYSYRRLFLSISETPRDGDLPACTAVAYSVCMTRLRQTVRSQASMNLPRCTTVYNRYTITTSNNEAGPVNTFFDNSSTALYSRIRLDLQCSDFVYIIYEERFQMSPQQLVAQVGGNIGLYTGISILGVWQLLAHAYTVYQKRQASIRARKLSTKRYDHRQVLDVFVSYFERTRGHWEHAVASTDGTKANCSDMATRIEKVEQKIDRIEKYMERMLHCMNMAPLDEEAKNGSSEDGKQESSL